MVVFDFMLLGVDGFEVCKSVCEKYKKFILMLIVCIDDVD